MQLLQFIDAMETIAPTRFAEAWDNVGLIAGDPAQSISEGMLTIDYTRAVAEESRRLKCDLIIAYHPPIFHPLKRLTAGSLVYDAIRHGVAIYSPHTALDSADGGTNDVLADAFGLENRSPLKPAETKESQLKLVTFVPESAIDRVSQALFDAGAGHIGNYSRCSFRAAGTGTFFGEEGANPTIGESGRLETAAEIRLETVIPIHRAGAIIAAMRKAHPYEEPAFDLVSLANPPSDRGMGRIGAFAEPVEREVLFARLKSALQLTHLLIAGPRTGKIAKAAVCAGACGDLLDHAMAQNARLYVTGEMRHHDALKAAEAGMTVVCTLHSNSERATLRRLKERLSAALPGLALHLSQADRDPFSVR